MQHPKASPPPQQHHCCPTWAVTAWVPGTIHPYSPKSMQLWAHTVPPSSFTSILSFSSIGEQIRRNYFAGFFLPNTTFFFLLSAPEQCNCIAHTELNGYKLGTDPKTQELEFIFLFRKEEFCREARAFFLCLFPHSPRSNSPGLSINCRRGSRGFQEVFDRISAGLKHDFTGTGEKYPRALEGNIIRVTEGFFCTL